MEKENITGGIKMLELVNVSYSYENKYAIQNINLTCDKGNIISIIGPNGAGKSTLVKCIVGLLRPQGGTVNLDNLSVLNRETKRSIGFLPEIIDFSPHMTINEVIDLVCEVKYQNKNLDNAMELKKRFSLETIGNKLIKECSMGMKKKLGIVIAFLGVPKVIVLDEPTNGVDADGILALKQLIKESAEQGSNIIVASHVLDFVEKISTSNLFIKDGTIEKCVQNNSNVDLELLYRELYL